MLAYERDACPLIQIKYLEVGALFQLGHELNDRGLVGLVGAINPRGRFANAVMKQH